MRSPKSIARIVGILFIIGTIAGVLSMIYSQSVLSEENVLVKVSENENQLIMAGIFVLIMGFSLSLMAIFMYPIARKFNKILAIGFVVYRGALEAVVYIAMAVSLFLLVPFSKELVGNGSVNATQITGSLLSEAHVWINNMLIIVFSLGAIIFYALLHKYKLIPRWITVWGFIAIILHLSTSFLYMFGITDSSSTASTIINIPIFLQEMVMAGWFIVKGFNMDSLKSKKD